MGKDHRGQPSGLNKQEGPGIKPVMSSENLEGSPKNTRRMKIKQPTTQNKNIQTGTQTKAIQQMPADTDIKLSLQFSQN